MDRDLESVLAQLDALRTTVSALAKAKGDNGAAAPPPGVTNDAAAAKPVADATGARPLRPLFRSPSLADTSDEDSSLRPALYPHPPRPQNDSLEESHWDGGLDALKLDSFQGFFNLSMLLLVFALTYIIVRNLKEHGVLLDLSDFTCTQVSRDMGWAAALIAGTYAAAFLVLLLVRLWIERALSWHATCVAYAGLQAAFLLVPVTFLYLTPIAPLPSAAILMVTSVVMLKSHSYVATNYAMFQEHVSRHGMRIVDAERDKVGLPLFKRLFKLRTSAAAAAPLKATGDKGALGATEPLSRSQARRRARKGGRSTAAAGEGAAQGPPGDADRPEDDSAFDELETQEAAEGDVPPVLQSPRLAGAAGGFSPSQGDAFILPPSLSAGGVGGSASPTAPVASDLLSAGTRAQRQSLVRMWPANVTLRDFAFFLAVPSLVYEPRYPRTRRVRWAYVARKLGEAALCAAFQYAVMKQFMLPVLEQGALTPHSAGDGPTSISVSIGAAAELGFSMMRLAMPSLFVWLTGFYMLFHCWCNALAEMLRFADRKFYGTWWNATDLRSFWKLWNLPVHEWCLRHVFVELRHYGGASSHVAIFGTFAFSAVFHELIFSVSFKTFRPWFFLGMLGQLPLIILSQQLRNKRRGNLLVWWALFSGQPLLEVLYFREWFSLPGHSSFFCVADPHPHTLPAVV